MPLHKLFYPFFQWSLGFKPKIFFGASDRLSGIDHYVLKIDDGDEFVLPASAGAKPFLLPKQPYGKVNLIVKAYDAAGNFFSASGSINIVPRWAKLARPLFESALFLIIVSLLTIISVGLLAVVIIFYFKHRKRKR